ncbi:MAG: pitrilysin family protein [Cyclobacteriaceae bacterium]
MKKIVSLLLFVCSLTFVNAQSSLVNLSNADIPFQKYALDNGLTLVVHEDHKAPIVSVNIWYHVGSKNEKLGKSGFAHLFEHLMFNGSEHFNTDYFKALESIGATDLNGTTNTDRTNYFQNVPLSAFDQVLWLESDRMGHLLGVIDQARLDEQRGVVQNEKRQGENQPYGREWEMATKASYPVGHPYSWTVIGSMEDLNAAALDDVKDWFKTYYGPANATLVIAGDVKPAEVFEKVKKYFGNIPSGPTLARHTVNIAKRNEDTRQYYQDRVTEPRISMMWNVPQWGTQEGAYLSLASSILTNGKSSRLYKKLVYEDQSSSYVFTYVDKQEISGNFYLAIGVKPTEDYTRVEATANEVLKEFLEKGVTEQELQRVKSEYFANFIKGMERIGGFGGKSDVLAESQVYGGSPDYYKKELHWIASATVADIQNVARKWLSSGKHTIICTPFPNYQASGTETDRSKLPALAAQPASSFPDIQRATLKNGMKIVLAQRKGIPTVAADLLFDAGYASDQFAKTGTANLALNLMDEGTQSMNALQISDKLQSIGTSIYTFSDLDASYVRMDALKASIDESLDVFADVVLNPAFPQNEFSRLQKEQINDIKRERTDPFSMVLRVFPKFLYGEGHAYSQPFTGSGYEETVTKITRDDILKFYTTWIKPNNATLVVVGDIEMKDLVSKIEKRFASWKSGDVPKKNLAAVSGKSTNKLYLMDRPESEQSVIIAGYLIEPYGKVSEISREAFVNVFGGDFMSRINMNLREDKHWSYGAGIFVPGAKGQRPFIAYAPVQTDKSKESMEELSKEFKTIVSDKPVTQEEFDRNKNNTIMGLPGQWETNRSVRQSLTTVSKYGLPDDYYKTYESKVRALTLEDVRKVGKQLVDPAKLNWFAVGDKEKILEDLKKLGFDEIILIDADGNPLQPTETQIKKKN